MAILTGQDYFALLDAPPHLVDALRRAWNVQQHEQAQRRKAQGHG